jgi:hypothetical protein
LRAFGYLSETHSYARFRKFGSLSEHFPESRKQFSSVPEQDRPRRLIIKITIGGQLVLGRRDRRRWHHRKVETH